MTLHTYWHTIRDSYRGREADSSDPDDPSESDSDTEEDSPKFVASPGWSKILRNDML